MKGRTTIDLGAGDDAFLTISASSDPSGSNADQKLEFAGDFSVSAGSGNDLVGLVLTSGTGAIDGKAAINLGAGDDTFIAAGDLSHLDVEAVLSGHLDGVHTADSTPATLALKKAITVTGGAGDDVAVLGNASVQNDLGFDMGAGSDVVVLIQIDVAGRLNLATGAGNDTVAGMFVSVAGAANLDLGADSDDALLVGVTLGKNSKVNLGQGRDRLVLGATTLADQTNLAVDGGGQNDALLIDPASSQDPHVKVVRFERDGASTLGESMADTLRTKLDQRLSFLGPLFGDQNPDANN